MLTNKSKIEHNSVYCIPHEEKNQKMWHITLLDLIAEAMTLKYKARTCGDRFIANTQKRRRVPLQLYK